MSLEPLELVRALCDGQLSLTDAIYSGRIPDPVLHHFACDCAERALLQTRTAGRGGLRRRLFRLFSRTKEVELQLWEALHAKRRWLEAELGDDAFARQSASLKRLLSGLAWHLEGDAAISVNCAMMRDAKDAAWCAAWYAVGVTPWLENMDDERQWQRKKLASLTEQCLHTRVHLLHLLKNHQETLGSSLQRHQQAMEEALF